MKKLLTLCTALLFLGSMMVVQAVDYYVAGTMNGWDTKDDANKMSLVSGTIYSKTFTAMGAASYDFKISTYNWGQSWGGDVKDNTQSNVTLSGSGDISFTLSSTSDVTFYFDAGSTKKIYVQATPVVVPSYTFTSGTTIYYDFRTYGAGVNLYNSVWNNEWKSDVSSIISITLSSAWEVTASSSLFKSAASDNWQIVKCTTLPTEGQNMIVSTDGKTYYWDTYVPPVDPTVDFVSLGSTIGLGLTANFAATSTNVDNPVYTFYVKKGSAAYGSAVTSYTFAEAGTYTVKVEVNGDDSKHAENTQEVTVVDGAHIIYYVKENAWAQVNAHMWGADPSTSWPGALMTLTASETEKHHYPVYAVTFTPNYVSIIFSNDGSNQSSDLDITYSTPYYYNGQWYATLADCDPLSVTLSGLEDSYLIGASATIAATSNLTSVSYTYQVKFGDGEFAALSVEDPYTFAAPGIYTFKVTATGDEGSKTATKEVNVYEPLTLYFVNKDAWENVNIYFYNPNKADWPGDAMTATGDVTEGHNYAVYSYTVASLYSSANVIFNNGLGTQTADLSVNSKHYFFDGEWYTTLAEIDPSSYVEFVDVTATILVNTPVALAATSNVANPSYKYYAKSEGGAYEAITSPHTFDAIGKYTLKVEALENGTGTPVAYREKDVEVYTTYTFTEGTRIYVDFSAMTEGAKGVNYPNNNAEDLDYDEEGAGTFKTIQFGGNVTWNTLHDFIKTAKADWAGLKFSVPGEGQNKIIVAADGASYTWGTYVPTYYLKNNWNGCDWTWQAMTASEDKFRLENVVYGGNGINYNYIEDDAEAIWKDYAKIKYMDGATAKVVAAYDTVNLVLDPANDTIWAEMVNKDTVVVYTVAGNTMALFDLGWTATHPYKYTDMKKQEDGTYLWNYGGESATLTAGNLEFKVIKSRDYANGSWPENPFVYTIQRSGEYHITIHFNPCSKDIWVDTTLVKTLNIQDFTLKGSDDWETGHPLTMGEENDKALITLSLTEGEAYEFKLVTADDKWYGDGQAFTRTNAAHRNVVEVNAGANMTLQVDKTGEYLFTYFFDTEELLVQYPAIVPEDKIAPLSGKFTINAHGDTAVFARGNLQYNYELDAWYTAEQQYDVLGDLNLRLGDNTYQGSIDLFGWSSENSDFGKQWKYKDADFTGAFVDWGTQFADDEKEWSTLSKEEWNFLLARQKDGHKLWTMIAIGPDSLNGLALFPNDWEAPSGLTIKYGFYDLDNETDYKANAFTFEQWESMEAAGAVFLPLAGTRAGYYGNTWSGTAESSLSNPLASGYDWVDNVNWMGYYWLSTPNSSNVNQIATIILPGWHNNKWTAPTLWDRERRRGQSVRLVTRIPKVDWTEVRSGLEADRYYTVCLEKNITDFKGATFWNMTYKDQDEATIVYIVEETAPEAGKPYIIQATNDNEGKLEVIYGDEVAATPVENGALRGTFENIDADDFAALEGTVYLLINNAIRPRTTGNYLNAHRAYIRYDLLTVPQTQNFAPGRRVKSMPLQPKVATGMEQAEISDKPAKAIIEGQLFILRGEKMYDATGRQVK